MNAFLALAAAASLITATAHLLVGGLYVVRPMMRSAELTRTVKVTLHYVWHMTTLVLLAMAAGFAYAAYLPDTAGPLAVLMTILAAAFAFLNVGVVALRRISPFFLPHWMLFAAIAALGFLGVMEVG